MYCALSEIGAAGASPGLLFASGWQTNPSPPVKTVRGDFWLLDCMTQIFRLFSFAMIVDWFFDVSDSLLTLRLHFGLIGTGRCLPVGVWILVLCQNIEIFDVILLVVKLLLFNPVTKMRWVFQIPLCVVGQTTEWVIMRLNLIRKTCNNGWVAPIVFIFGSV